MSDMEFGKCEVCGKDNVPLFRTYFNYDIPGIKCTCHSPNHFVVIRHCCDCKATEPQYTKMEFKTEDLHSISSNTDINFQKAMEIIIEKLDKDKSYYGLYYVWQSNIACTIMDNSDIDHETANIIAKKFLDQLCKK